MKVISMSFLKKVNIYQMLFLVLGIISPAPIVMLGGKSLYTIVMYICVLILIMGCRVRTMQCKWNYPMMFFAFSVVLSSFVSLFFIDNAMWRNRAATELINYLCMILIVCIAIYREKDSLSDYFKKGVYYSCVFQVGWGFLQILLWKAKRLSINDLIFCRLLHMTNNTTQFKDGTIAVTGLCWNSGHFAPVITVAYALSANIFVKGIIIVLAVFSKSRTTLLGIMMCACLEVLFERKRVIAYIKQRKGLVLVCVGAIAAMLVVAVGWEKIWKELSEMIDKILNYRNDDSGRIHANYYRNIWKIVSTRAPIGYTLFGYGISCSGYPYSVYLNQYTGSGAWVVESDFINFLFSFGLFGFVIIYGIIAKTILLARKYDRQMFVLFVTLVFEGITYNVMFKWVILLLLMQFMFLEKKQRMKHVES